jgi:hypothetical protein
MDNLNYICADIEKLKNGSQLDSGILYPYFYSFHLYEPVYKVGETIDDQFRQGKWYAPSVGELSRIIYYRGISSGGKTFEARAVR